MSILKYIAITALMFATTNIQSQKSDDKPRFDANEWDFGTINEVDGSVSHVFHLLNYSKKDVRIAHANPSCNCISATYDTKAIAPGKVGDVEVRFSPAGAVGKTYRNVEMFDSEGNSLGFLTTCADVVPSDRSIQDRYYYTLTDGLYANKTTLPFGYVYHGKMAQKVVYIANASKSTLKIKLKTNNSSTMRAVCPEELTPDKESAITITYTMPDDASLYKTFRDTIYIYVNGQLARTPITTSAICLTKLDENGQVPDMQTYPSEGALSEGWFSSTLSGKVEISNKGKSDLIIYAVETPEGVSTDVKAGTTLKPGSSLDFEVESTSLKEFRVSIFTNDPKRPYKELTFNKKQ